MRKFFRRHTKVVRKVAYICFVIALLYITFKFFLPFFAPFIIALFISAAIEPLINFLDRRLQVRRKLGTAVALLLGISIVGTILALSISRLYKEAVDLGKFLSEWLKKSDADITLFLQQAKIIYDNLNPEVVAIIQENITNLLTFVRDFIFSIFNYSKLTITSIPKVFIGFIITLISAYFISSDKDKILVFIQKQLPPRALKKFESVRVDMLKSFGGYMRAMLAIMGITFCEVAIGLSLIGVKYSVVLALIIAIIDILPVLGTGTVLIPWMIWNLIIGNVPMALSLLILYCVVLLVRQLLEPKIIGSHIGLHPLVTLIAIYTGLNLFGVFGMIFGPIVALIIKNLQSAGVIKLWNE